MSYLVDVRKISERERAIRALNRAHKKFKEAFALFVRTGQSESTYRKIREAIGRGDIESAMKVVDQLVADFANVRDDIFVETANAESTATAKMLGPIAAAVSFDIRDTRSAYVMQASKLALIRQVQDEQRNAIRQAITRQFADTGSNPRTTSIAFVRAIGLTATQEAAVHNYRVLLEQKNTEALSRKLRNRRMDGIFGRAVASDEPILPEVVDRMVEAYRRNYLAYRAETIARTESLRAVSQARQEANKQVIDSIGVDHSRVERTWHSMSDHRTRDAHIDMDGQTVGLDEPFVDGDGNQLMYPGDPSAPGETTISCRCTFTIRLKD